VSPCASHAFLTGNGGGLELDFDGIVAGLEGQRQQEMAKKQGRRKRAVSLVTISRSSRFNCCIKMKIDA
jgi:hypothetical protein